MVAFTHLLSQHFHGKDLAGVSFAHLHDFAERTLADERHELKVVARHLLVGRLVEHNLAIATPQRSSGVGQKTQSQFRETRKWRAEARVRRKVVARGGIVADQVGGPTCAADIADACLTIAAALRADSSKSGTYHFSGGPDVSWADFAREIFAQAGIACEVADIPSSAYPTPAQRPLNSRMDNSATEAAFGIARPDWRAGLRALLADLEAEG